MVVNMKIKHWIRIIIYVVSLALALIFASNLLCVANEKDALGIYGFFKEPEDSLDVVLIGPSTIYTAFYSPLAYEKQGFTSYSLSSSTMTASLYKYAAQMAVEYQHPDLLVFDTWSFCYDAQYDETSLRKFLDACPDSEIKKSAIREIVPEELRSSFEHPFQKYHSAWTRLGECIQVLRDKIEINRQGYSITKNYATTPDIVENRRRGNKHKDGDYHISEAGFEQLHKLLDYLKTSGVENVLFIRTPEMLFYEPDDTYKQMVDTIREAGFDFVNLNSAVEDMHVNFDKDFYNTTHFNVFGTEKFTEFLSDYIMNRYGINTQHDEQIRNEWDLCASCDEHVLGRLKELTEQRTGGFLYTQGDLLADGDRGRFSVSGMSDQKRETGGDREPSPVSTSDQKQETRGDREQSPVSPCLLINERKAAWQKLI